MFFRSKTIKILTFLLVFGVILFLILHVVEFRENYAFGIREVSENEEINAKQLVNLHNFTYLFPNKLCQKLDQELLGIIIITSYVGHDALRAAHRRAISQQKLQQMGLLRVFLLAEIPVTEKFITQEQIVDENRRFGDLLQGNFQEAYRNLTYKHLMGLKWSVMECAKAKFIIKADDDIVFDVFHVKNYLESLELQGNLGNFMAGYILDNKTPIRIAANKWFVSRDDFPGSIYPDYLSGWLYFTNANTARALLIESQSSSFFWIDDTFVTGILRDRVGGIPLIRLNKWFSANSEFLDCCLKDIKNNSFECEYFVGPNGGDTNLIVEFLHEIEKCYFDECSKRDQEHSLKRTCVAKFKNLLQDHGEALIRAVPLR